MNTSLAADHSSLGRHRAVSRSSISDCARIAPQRQEVLELARRGIGTYNHVLMTGICYHLRLSTGQLRHPYAAAIDPDSPFLCMWYGLCKPQTDILELLLDRHVGVATT